MVALQTHIEVLISYLGWLNDGGILEVHQSDTELFWYISDSRDFVVIWTLRIKHTFWKYFSSSMVYNLMAWINSLSIYRQKFHSL